MLQVFNSPDGQEIRVVDQDGAPWFVASDVAKALGYRDAHNMTRRLDEEDRGTRQMSTPSGDQDMTIISEPGLYASIMGSEVQGAKAFKHWVTHEVLPSIRKTGGYQTAPRPSLSEITDPMELERLASVLTRKASLLRELDAIEIVLGGGESRFASSYRSEPKSNRRHRTSTKRVEPKVSAWVQEFVLPDINGVSITGTKEVIEGLGMKLTRSNEVLVGQVLLDMGFEKNRMRTDGVRSYVYTREVATFSE